MPTQHSINQFARMLKTQFPIVYQKIMNTRPALLVPGNNLGQTDTTDNTQPVGQTSWGDKILSFVETALPLYYQNEMLEMQIKRAENGLPPLETSQIAPTVRHEVAPQTTNTIMMLGLAGIAALVLINMNKGKRK